MIVLRAPMHSRDDAVDVAAAVAWALRQDVVGVGGRLTERTDDLDAALRAVDAAHGERVAARLRRFADAPDGTLVWTRDGEDRSWLGRVEGPWRHDVSATATRHDLQHVRPCRWTDRPLGADEVPEPVLATVARGGRNLQRIHGAEASSAALAARLLP